MQRAFDLLWLTMLGAASSGCDVVRMQTVESADTVISTRTEIVPSNKSVSSHVEVDRGRLYVEARQGCDLVEKERVRQVEIREGDEDPTEEIAVLSAGTIPFTTGIVLLVDSKNVYDNDPNQRLYNPTGPRNAIIAGSVLTVLGTLLMVAPTIHMIRVGIASDQVETESDRVGRLVEQDVPCQTSERPLRTTVMVRVDDQTVWSASTQADGRLDADLAAVVPRAYAETGQSAMVVVAGKPVAELDMAAVRAAHVGREREDAVWRSVDVGRCEAAPPGDQRACRPVEAFLRMYPDGAHAAEARRVLERRGIRPRATIAADPLDPATQRAIEDASSDSFRAARKACEETCRRSCSGRAECLPRCLEAACPVESPPHKGGPR